MSSISPDSLLHNYLQNDFASGWCMAMVISKEGSSYRTPGALMLVSPDGEASGMVSGGCLEANVVLRSRQVLSDSQPRYIEYDMIDDESFAAELGIGCRGKIGVFIQPLTSECHQLLTLLKHELSVGRECYLVQHYDSSLEKQHCRMMLLDTNLQALAVLGAGFDVPVFNQRRQHDFIREENVCWSFVRLQPAVNLTVFGGGTDARPLVAMASILGWQVTVVDHRPGYARHRYFPTADRIVRKAPDVLSRDAFAIDVAVVLTHSLSLDADWLRWLFEGSLLPIYIGLLGPHERRQRVLCDIPTIDSSVLERGVRGPVGLDLGGELPESIALAVLADMHAVIYQASVTPLYDLNPGSVNSLKARG